MLRFFVLLNGFVSVSLYVSVDSNKAFMKVIMEKRREMWHAESGTKLKVRMQSPVHLSHVYLPCYPSLQHPNSISPPHRCIHVRYIYVRYRCGR